MGAGECLLVGALLVEAAVQVGQLGAGGLLGGPAGCVEDGVGELLGVVLGGVAAGPQGGNVDVVDESGRGDALAGQIVDVEAGEVVFDEAVGVVVGVWWWLVQIVRQVDVAGVWVGFGTGSGCFGLFGGVGDVGVDGGGVVGEQFDAVGEQAGVFVGAQRLGGGDVVQVVCGCGEQVGWGPVGGGDGGDKAGPGGVGDDGFGDSGAQ